MMKRLFASAVILSAISGFGIVGCGDTAKEETKIETTSDKGKTTETATHEVTKSNPNAPVPGEPGSATTETTTVKP